MSVHAGIDIVNDGQILSYDMSNVKKSWKGRPTTNLHTLPTNFSSWSCQPNSTIIAQTSNIDALNSNLSYRFSLVGLATSNQLYLRNVTLTANLPYTFSCYFKYVSGGTKINFTGYTYGTPSGWNGVTINLTDVTTLSLTTIGSATGPGWEYIKDGWFRVWFTLTQTVVSAAVEYNINYELAGGISAYTASSWDLCYAQLEQLSVVSPYITGSRTTAQSIIDQTGNVTITASSVTYNNDGTFSFAAGNYLSCPFTKSASMTISAWATTTVAPASQAAMLFNAGASGSGPDLFFYQSSIFWNIWDGTANPFGAIPASANDGKYHNYVLVNESGVNARLYYDGALLGTAIYRSPTANTNFAIGGGGAGDYSWVGNIGMFSVHNRALTVTEILQNFNAAKSRY